MLTGKILSYPKVVLWFLAILISMLFSVPARAGSLYVSDYNNELVKRYDSSTGAYITPDRGNYYLDSPKGIEFSSDGSQFFVSNTGYSTKYVQKFNTSTGYGAGTLGSNVTFDDLYLAPNGWLYATGSHSTYGSLYRYNPSTGTGGQIASSISGGSSGVTMGWDGDIYVSNYSTCTITRFTQYGQNLGVVISGIGNSSVGGLTFGPDGHIYVAGHEGTSGYVYKYNGWDYQFMQKYPVGSYGLTDIEFGPDGFLYVASFDQGKVRRMSTITGAVSDFVSPGYGGLGNPWSIAFESEGPILGDPQSVGDNDVRLNVVEILGDAGAETTSVGSLHGLSAQSLSGMGLVTKTNTVRRNFAFTADGGGTDPLTVFLNGTLEGQLLSDNLGKADVTASIEILDLNGTSLGYYSKKVSVQSMFGSQHNADVFEQMGIEVELTPGEAYEMVSTLTVSADGGLEGAGRAFFDNTFTAEFGETLLPEPASMSLLAIGAMALLRRRRK